MLSALVAFTLSPLFAQLPPGETTPAPEAKTVVIPRDGSYAEVIRYQEVRPLPGGLDETPVFNSNSPEVVQQNGILLSTFPKDGMASPDAHLNYAFNGRFDLFAHHIARGVNADDRRTLFMGVVVYNPGDEPIDITIHQGVSYLSQEAPFINLPDARLSSNGSVYAGPGSRTTTDMLRGANQSHWPERITLPPGHVQLLMNTPIPLRSLTVPINGSYPQGGVIPKPPIRPVTLTAADAQINPETGENGTVAPLRPIAPRPIPSNGRTSMMYLSSSGPVHVASLARYADVMPNGNERVPTLQDWLQVLKQGNLAGPRDIPPSDPSTYRFGRFYYGRVAGVAKGASWKATLTDSSDTDVLTIPAPGNAFSYVISSVDRNTFGTGQIQSAPMVARYPDTAFRAHGNYGVRYSLKLPFYNNRGVEQAITLKFQTPMRDEELVQGLRFRRPPEDRVFFRGTVRLKFRNQMGLERTHYVHLVQRRGQEAEALLKLNIPAEARQDLEVDLVYPPDATPPQVLTVLNEGVPAVLEAETIEAPVTPALSRDL
ncbi:MULTISPECIES: DUF3370 domain-containing protein [unclassified Nodosilinea]|uniref:DUF3370 domain-containing protein n=1 Tax=Leptolyngbya subtilissima DQ-A4 TaxID=2933933 RepID=A0ABV0K3X9_9CYAN|nr:MULTISPECIES: DUF3370 domain-containing protein [unclassified Nodosilinea]MBD2106976.1 DUF3370 domain-containing protein [Nodosilinea sp. FACHB-13]MBD2113432.1 DUF3370 domain-containing protein [Nodosilinea sp. FACHB-141]